MRLEQYLFNLRSLQRTTPLVCIIKVSDCYETNSTSRYGRSAEHDRCGKVCGGKTLNSVQMHRFLSAGIQARGYEINAMKEAMDNVA